MGDERKPKTIRQIVWSFIISIGVIIGILGGIAEFSGMSLKDYLGSFIRQERTNCVVPDLSGLTEVFARVELNNLGLITVKQNIFDENFKIGTVITQYPTAGTILKNCEGEVVIQVSSTREKNNIVENIPTPRDLKKDLSNTSGGWGLTLFSFFGIGLIIYFFLKIILKLIDFLF